MVNFIGCLVWLLYGSLNLDFPVITVNSAIAMIHLYSFIKSEEDDKTKELTTNKVDKGKEIEKELSKH